MHSIGKDFFLNLDVESPDEDIDGSLQTVFQNETSIMSKDNSDYVKKLKEQISKIDNLKRK